MSRRAPNLLLLGLIVFTSSALLLDTLDAAPTAAEQPNNEGRIVGGQKTTIASYPYQVSVRLDTYILLHICGGSLYAPRVVITAAHCIKGRFASYIFIVAGRDSIADETDMGMRVTKLISHTGYNKKTHENDVGLIIMAEPLVYSAVVQPISLAVDYPAAGANAVVTGWGKSDEEATTLTNILQVVEIQIVDADVCSSQYGAKNYAITEQMICAGVEEGGKDTCNGDSGGPLAVDGVLVGIVSWGIGCARTGFPGVYASATFHKQWIEDNAKTYL